MEMLPSYHDIKSRFPLKERARLFIEKSRATIVRILNGEDPRLLLIVGPCSIHDPQSAQEFALKLKRLASSLSSHFFFVMRVYCEKPRTISGWKGFLYDPFLDGSYATHIGIEKTRALFLQMADLEIPTASEFLDPLAAFYYEDLVTWGSIGARTATSQTHRQLASQLPMPIGLKNGIAGNISAAVNGVLSASHSHTCMRLGEQGNLLLVQTPGNPHAHVVLRGGESGPNYDPESIQETLNQLQKHHLPSRLIVDCSHHNSEKKYERQAKVFQSLIHQISQGNQHIRGIMLESHLFAGNQPFPHQPCQLEYGISITDPCLDWESTADLLKRGAHTLDHALFSSSICTTV